MDAALALEMLGQSAETRVAEKTHARLRDAEAVVGAPFARVALELDRIAREGASPATLAASHLIDAGGKRVRPLSVLLSCACFGEIDASVEKLAIASELVHAATLLHDDVVDDGSERRGMPTARRVFGNAVSVLAGDLLLVHALQSVSEAGQPQALTELFATLRTLVDGEVVQLRGRTALDVSEATYQRIVRDKTASLFVWALRAGARAGGASERAITSFGEFGAHLGVAFQLVDDVIDYATDAKITGKKLCADLLEGKLTLPLILTLREEPAVMQLVERLRAGESELAESIAARVRESSALGVVRARAAAETGRAIDALSDAPVGAPRTLLIQVATELAARAS